MIGKLNQRQERFCLEYIVCGNGTKAAVAAGYSPKMACSIGSRLQRNVNIQARIHELNEVIVSEKIADARERKEVLSEIARGRLNDFVRADEDGAHIHIDLKSANTASLQEVSTTTTHYKNKKGEDGEVSVTKLKLYNPIQAIAELNKMEGDYAPEKHAVLGGIVIEIVHRDKKPLEEGKTESGD